MWRKLGTLGLALLWDRLLGEPPNPVHPVAMMGRAAKASLEGHPTGAADEDYQRGAIVAAALPVATMAASALCGRFFRRLGSLPAMIGDAYLLKSSFAIRAMADRASDVERSLAMDDIEGARKTVSDLVSRDVSTLDESGIAGTTIGTVAENVTDSITGPFFYYALFGIPGALAYRAVDTLDSMIGYRGKYEHLGRVAARIDDAVSYAPARLAGASVVASAAVQDGFSATRAARTMAAQSDRTDSPNGGWPIGATAGALGVEIEKVGHYTLGPPDSPPARQDIGRAVKLFNGAAVVAAAATAAIIIVRSGRR